MTVEEPVDSLDSVLRSRVEFQEHRTVLPVGERVPWRISLLVLTVGKFNGQAASIGSLHLIMWGLRGPVPRGVLRSWLLGVRAPDLVMTRLDPHLETTVRLAAAEQLVRIGSTGRVHLSERGMELAALIDADGELLVVEKQLLADISPLNDSSIARRMGVALNGM